MIKENSRTIKSLEKNAKKGNLLSMFQLYENYSTGNYVEENRSLANHYLSLLAEKVSESKFTLKSINLYEFRRFRELDIELDEKLTVIIGNNGVGKTSIVDAIAKTFTWFNTYLEKDANGRPITQADVNINATDYSEVITKIKLNNKTQFTTALTKKVSGSIKSKSSSVSDIKLAGLIYRHLAKHKAVSIPLLAYYSVERSDFRLNQSIAEKVSDNLSTNRFDSLDSALEGSGKLKDFSDRYIELVNLAKGESTTKVKELRKQIINLEGMVKKIHKEQTPPTDDSMADVIRVMREELDEALKVNSSTKYQKQLKLVNKAIENIVPDVTDFEIDRSTGQIRLMVHNFGNRVNISQLSQGQITLVTLIGDLARRLVRLNPDADDALQGHGIVIIDEIELHLHPKWQQNVLLGLQTTFPNIQFIITTHSQQVLSHVKSANTVIALKNENGIINQCEVQSTYGKNSDRIYEDNMNVSSRPMQIQKEFDEIFILIDQKKLKEAKDKIGTLRCVIGEDGQLIKASTLIKRIEMIGR